MKQMYDTREDEQLKEVTDKRFRDTYIKAKITRIGQKYGLIPKDQLVKWQFEDTMENATWKYVQSFDKKLLLIGMYYEDGHVEVYIDGITSRTVEIKDNDDKSDIAFDLHKLMNEKKIETRTRTGKPITVILHEE